MKCIQASFFMLLLVLSVGACSEDGSAPNPSSAADNASTGNDSSLNLLLLCSSCGLDVENHQNHPHVILLNQTTGNVLAYHNFTSSPLVVGKLQLESEAPAP
jgi:hypothetical protein